MFGGKFKDVMDGAKSKMLTMVISRAEKFLKKNNTNEIRVVLRHTKNEKEYINPNIPFKLCGIEVDNAAGENIFYTIDDFSQQVMKAK